MKRIVFLSLTCLWLVACDGDTGTDAGPMPDGSMTDSGPADGGGDDAGSDAGPPDAGPVLCGGVMCGADEACVRDQCLATCGADLSGWDAVLMAGAAPVGNFCRAASARHAVVGGAHPIIYDLTQSMDGATFVYTVSRWTATPGTAIVPEEIAVHRVEPSADWGAATPYPSGYVAVSPSETSLLFGYTVFVSADPLEVPGEIIVATIASGNVDARVAPGNFDAAWVGDDTFVVNGQGLGAAAEGSGLYASERGMTTARRVASGIGVSNGSVAVTSEYLLAGGYSTGPQVSSLSRSEFDTALAAGTSIDLMVGGMAVESSIGVPLSSVFRVLADGRIVVAEYMGPLRAYGTTFSAAGLALDPADVLATGVFTDVLSAGPSRLIFVHPDGLLLASMM